MRVLSGLNREQKEAIGLLQIGTFLEYFDLMLYVHMAVILNELFFPKTDPHTAALLSAFAFCSTYVLRPLGALVFGYIGDNIGRKATVIITTMMMSLSCIIMASLPTYAQIGITAAWVVTLCRIIQGISSMGEIIGAEIYLTEMTKPPASYQIVSLISCAARLGTMVALGVSTAVLSIGIEWRIAFWFGAAVAVIGSVARTRLRETPEFLNHKKNIKLPRNSNNTVLSKAENKVENAKSNLKNKASFKTVLAYFLMSSGPPACLYFSYMYFVPLLKGNGLSSEFIVRQNFFLSIIEFLAVIVIIYLSKKLEPLKIVKYRSALYLLFIILFPLMMCLNQDYHFIFFIQFLSIIFTLTGVPAIPILIKHFPVLRRFTYTSLIYALSRAVIYVITSFGLVYFTEWFGHLGACFILLPITGGFLWGVHHFEKLENSQKAFADKPLSPYFSNLQNS
ncbi:MFS transporter [Candidatus Paracaedibacter symbiosus]|uniref:MFS transporter n=1 Tax=Candidatus Paracaedibacter symbiosus TaxID=244582 RepID=UPI00068981D5|nr:MFS transporter [Candidatus Paracaedibacter symbiosus]